MGAPESTKTARLLVREEIRRSRASPIHAPLDEHRSLGYWHTEEEEIRGEAV